MAHDIKLPAKKPWHSPQTYTTLSSIMRPRGPLRGGSEGTPGARGGKRKYFEHAGALLTADGTDDELIKLEGTPANYKLVIPTFSYLNFYLYLYRILTCVGWVSTRVTVWGWLRFKKLKQGGASRTANLKKLKLAPRFLFS